jgi:hypothetical protein
MRSGAGARLASSARMRRRYGNLSGDSGVTGYEIGRDRIEVWFRGGASYVYTHASAGREAIERMKELAESGRGLSTFISVRVRDRYETWRDEQDSGD